jgi:hypothetical protein
MLTYEQLIEECIRRSDQFGKELVDYTIEAEEKADSITPETKEDAFKSWAIQKLAINETIQKNTSEQQNVVVGLLYDTQNKIDVLTQHINLLSNVLSAKNVLDASDNRILLKMSKHVEDNSSNIKMECSDEE